MDSQKNQGTVGKPKGDAIANELKRYHELGQTLNGERKQFSNAQQIERYEISQQIFYKACAFARLYSVADLERLCQRRFQQGKSTGTPFTWAHVIQLLSVRQKKLRRSIEAEAEREGWTTRELALQVKQRCQREGQNHGGRPFTYASEAGSAVALESALSKQRRYLTGLFALTSDDGTDVLDAVVASLPERKGDRTKYAARLLHEIYQVKDCLAELEARLTEVNRRTSKRSR